MLSISQPLYQQAYETIKKTILSGELSPGSKLVTTKMAEQYQISRTPLREALRQLQIEGLLISTHNGMEVVTLDKEDFEHLSHCRLVLEKDIIIYIVNAISDGEIEQLESIVKEAEEACEAKENMKLLELNTLFHSKLHESCSNKRLVQLLNQVRSLLLIYRANSLNNQIANKEVIKEHQDLLQSIKNRDVDKALISVEQHLENDVIRASTVIK